MTSPMRSKRSRDPENTASLVRIVEYLGVVVVEVVGVEVVVEEGE